MTLEEEEVDGILKLNSRILESHELRKLDKSEKGLLNSTLITQKGNMQIGLEILYNLFLSGYLDFSS